VAGEGGVPDPRGVQGVRFLGHYRGVQGGWVHCELDTNQYPKGIVVSDDEMDAIAITRAQKIPQRMELHHLAEQSLRSTFDSDEALTRGEAVPRRRRQRTEFRVRSFRPGSRRAAFSPPDISRNITGGLDENNRKSTYNRSAGGERHDRKCLTGRKPTARQDHGGGGSASNVTRDGTFPAEARLPWALWPELSDTDDRTP